MNTALTPAMAYIIHESHRLTRLAMEEIDGIADSPVAYSVLFSKAVVFCAFAELFGPEAAEKLASPIIDA